MKKAAVAGVALALSLAACAPGPVQSPAGPPEKVTMWMFPVIADAATSQAFWAKAEQDFDASQSRYDLSIELRPWSDAGAPLSKAIKDGSGPDLVLLTADALAGYAASKQLLPMLAAQDPGFSPAGVRDASFGGEAYAIPLYQSAYTTAYNTQAFRKAGVKPPTDWAGLREAAPLLAAKNVALLDYPENAPLTSTFYPLLWQAGGQVFSDDHQEVAFDSNAGLAVLQLLVALKAQKALSADSGRSGGAIAGSGLTDGSTAMTISASLGDVEILTEALGKGAVSVGQPLRDAQQATYGTTGLLARTAVAEDEVSVTAVATYLGSADFETQLAKASGTFPARIDVSIKGNDVQKAFGKARPFARQPGYPKNADKVMQELRKQISLVIAGDKSAKAALSEAARKGNELLAG